jgi:glycine dehydrogenase subunit 2
MRNTLATQSLFELAHPGRRAATFPASDVPDRPLSDLLPADQLADAPPPLPELSEPDVVRHFVNLSTLNMSVDTHFYPLGSCTMKYNPKRHERLARLSGIGDLHPNARPEDCQGMLAILHELQEMLAEIAGLPAVSLQPAAGAQGELTALLVAAAYFRDRGETRTKVLFPASAHGTNPASAALAGFECVQINKAVGGLVDLEDLKTRVDGSTAVFMITNPNTLGLFEKDIAAISRVLHDQGALVYIDGANMNANVGVTRPGDFGGDMMHYNVHKTFTGPHGAGGPGAGPIAVREFLADYLPGPVIRVAAKETGASSDFGFSILDFGLEDAQEESRIPNPKSQIEHPSRHGAYELVTPPRSIGRVRSFFGNVGILLRGYFYLRTLGAQGVRDVAEQAVLNANYLKARLKDILPVPHGERCMHEFVASARRLKEERGITAMDIAKRLLDYGFHAPTVYFPLVVPESIMIEPTETESKETLDRFADALAAITREDPQLLHDAPHTTPVSRPDEVAAARQPVLRWPGP